MTEPMPDPGNAPPEAWTEPLPDDHTEDVFANETNWSVASGAAAGSEEATVDVNDHEAVTAALANGQRANIDPKKMTLEQRMSYGLLTAADDEARVRGDLGSHITTSEGAKRTNVGDGLPGDNG